MGKHKKSPRCQNSARKEKTTLETQRTKIRNDNDIGHGIVQEESDPGGRRSGRPPSTTVRRKSLVERLTRRKMSMQMKKSISLLQVTASLIAVTGHTAVFITPSSILENTGSLGVSLIVWLFGGVVNWMQALIFVEFGTSLDEAGGAYSYVKAACGPLAGFMMLWSYMMLATGPFWSFLSYTAAVYGIKPIFPSCSPPDVVVKVIAALLIRKYPDFEERGT